MTRTQVRQEIRQMRFEEACGGWQARRLERQALLQLLPAPARQHASTPARGSYTWVKNTLQGAGLVAKAPARGKHRRMSP